MEHFMIKRTKYSDDVKLEDLSECDSTYVLEVDPRSPPDVKLPEEVFDESVPLNKSQTEGSQTSDDCIPTGLPDVPYQPDNVPPYRDRRRPHLFQKKWYQIYPWLHYDAFRQSMFCFQCLSAINRKVVVCPPQNIFARGGFKNWKKGIERFRVHENTQLHRDTSEFSVKRLLGLKEKCSGVECIISSINFLLSVGYDPRQPNFLSGLLQLRKSDLPLLYDHLSRTSFTSKDERELLSIMTSSTMRAVSALIKECGPYGLVLEKVNVHGETMFAATARTTRQMKSEELYLGLYTDQNILLELVNYLNADDLRLYCCDMIESKTIAESFENIQPHVLALHCPNHNICLDLQEVLKTTSAAGRTLVLLDELRPSSMCKYYFNEECSDNQVPLCSKRKMITFKTISAVLAHYADVVADLEQYTVRNPTTFTCSHLLTELRQRSTLSNMLMYKVLLYPIENLNSLLDKTESVKGVKEAADSVLHILESSKGDEFETFWLKCLSVCEPLKNIWLEPFDTIAEFKASQKANYFETIEAIVQYVRSKFCNPSYEQLLLFETSLLRTDDQLLEEEEAVLKAYDLNPDSFRMEKRMLQMMGNEFSEPCTLSQTVLKFRDMKAGTLALIPELVKSVDFLRLAQVVRCGEGRSQRLKNLKKFLELNRCSELINELSILYVYKDEPFMNAREVAQEYLESDSERLDALFK